MTEPGPGARRWPSPTEIEVRANLLLGPDSDAPQLPEPRGLGVLAALEVAVWRALERPPTFVSFSGGRDSSAVLAVATAVARRNGLADPVPAIMRFSNAPNTDETSWQELVLEHLGIERYEVIELSDDLDALGPAATATLLRRGVRFPGNAYMHEPLLARAHGGSLLTGVGGDEVLGTRASRHVVLARGRDRPRRADVRHLALAALPRRAREAVWRARQAPRYAWLTPEGAAELSHVMAREEMSWPHRYDRALVKWHASRGFAAVDAALPALAEDHDVMVVNPLVDDRVLAELKIAGGATGYRSRTAAMRELFGHLLPDSLLARETKAVFSAPVWGPRMRSFARDWSGAGVDAGLVDVEAVRAEWLSPEPDFRTILLLHAAWLASRDQGSASSS